MQLEPRIDFPYLGGREKNYLMSEFREASEYRSGFDVLDSVNE
jgi:hypothetical protein